MGQVYKTANGKEIDMQQLALKNEEVRAVGNMNVNARGDVIDNKNKKTSTRASQVNKIYRKQIGNVAVDEPIVSSKKAANVAKQYAASEQPSGAVTEILAGLDEPMVEASPVAAPIDDAVREAAVESTAEAKPTDESAPAGGLAAAIAAANKDK